MCNCRRSKQMTTLRRKLNSGKTTHPNCLPSSAALSPSLFSTWTPMPDHMPLMIIVQTGVARFMLWKTSTPCAPHRWVDSSMSLASPGTALGLWLPLHMAGMTTRTGVLTKLASARGIWTERVLIPASQTQLWIWAAVWWQSLATQRSHPGSRAALSMGKS